MVTFCCLVIVAALIYYYMYRDKKPQEPEAAAPTPDTAPKPELPKDYWKVRL